MEKLSDFLWITRIKIKRIGVYALVFVKWLVIAGITGILGGLIGTIFNMGISYATRLHQEFPNLLFLMPLLGLVIVFMYQKANLSRDGGTNLILHSIRHRKGVPIIIAPLIFVSTIITHLVGGSAGREGAALTVGGGIGAQVGRIFKLDEKDMNTAVMCGMGALFSALFNTPLTAAFFAMEVIAVGVLYYSAFVPCVVSALSAFAVSWVLNGGYTNHFKAPVLPELSFVPVISVGFLAILCALMSILFCLTMKYSKVWLTKLIKNPYLKMIAGSCLFIALVFIFGDKYTGLGTETILDAANEGNSNYYDFFLKMVFTALTMAIGFKGGEIVPTLFIGSTFGCTVGYHLGLDPTFGAAIGIVAVFCGVVNCPIASVMLSVELFGGEGIPYFVVAVCISYMLSGYYSIYSSQRFAYSKLHAEYVNMKAN